VTHRVPTSQILERLVQDAPEGTTSLEWVLGHLRERSFGIVMLLIGAVALVPGASGLVGVLLAIPAAQMILGHDAPALPGWIARRPVRTSRLVRMLGRAIPVLRRLERLVRPRWATPFDATKRVIGTVILLLGITLVAPIPFSQYLPATLIMLLAFAWLEEDGVLLALALGGALVSIAATAAAVWGSVEAGLLLG
jgi:hypothetical protein